MTPQEAKQKAIIEAYGQYWHIAKNYADENGWISFNKRDDETPSLRDLGIEGSGKLLWEEDWDDDLYGYRPKSIQGIETNNGWTLFDEHPKSDQMAFFIIYENKYMCVAHWDNDKKEFYSENLFISNVSHYMPIGQTIFTNLLTK